MSQRIRVEPTARFILPYLELFNYPHTVWLEDPSRLEYCVGARVLDKFGTIGVVWGHWVQPKQLAAHVLMFPGTAANWDEIMPKLLLIADFLGADEILVSFDGTPRAKALCRLVERYGFVKTQSDHDDLSTFYRRPTYEQPLCSEDSQAE